MFLYTYKRKPYLNFGFRQGVKLDDPKGLLEGTGKGMRHLKVCSASDLERRQIIRWVKQAMTISSS